MPELYDTVTKKIYPLDGVNELYIGRGAPAGHLRIAEEVNGVSRRHAMVSKKGDNFFIEDLGSSHGTWVDEIRVEAPMALKKGSRIYLGAIKHYSILYRETYSNDDKQWFDKFIR